MIFSSVKAYFCSSPFLSAFDWSFPLRFSSLGSCHVFGLFVFFSYLTPTSHLIVDHRWSLSVGATDVFKSHVLLSFSSIKTSFPAVYRALVRMNSLVNHWPPQRCHFQGHDWLQAVWRFMPLVSSPFRSTVAVQSLTFISSLWVFLFPHKHENV